MTPEQEKDLLEGQAAMKSQLAALAPIAAKVPELEKSLAAKEAVIAELQKGHSTLSQGADLTAFKTAYPDVPESVFHSTPADKRSVIGKELQESFSKVKASQAKTDSKDPMSLWADAGGIGPTDDASVAAEAKVKSERVAEAKKSGDPLAMLRAKGSRVLQHLAQTVRQPVGS